MTIHIKFGALCDSITKQLRAQGYRLKVSASYQKDADAITRLAVRGLLPAAQANAARKRLMKDIGAELLSDERKGPSA